MSEEKSDITFKVQEKMIPAQKQLLIEKSKFFANLFKSNLFLITHSQRLQVA